MRKFESVLHTFGSKFLKDYATYFESNLSFIIRDSERNVNLSLQISWLFSFDISK